MVLKNMYFFNFDFLRYFGDFFRFWLDLGRPWALQKFEKIRKNRVMNAISFERGFWEGSGRFLGGFWTDFIRIWDRFSKNFRSIFEIFGEDLEGKSMKKSIVGCRTYFDD